MLRPGPHREGEEPKPMMHERGKSDSAVGAMKPANKAERSAAELVEQRAGTKGNADQQSTRRAQERESVSQALGRIRQAAKQRKKEKFSLPRPTRQKSQRYQRGDSESLHYATLAGARTALPGAVMRGGGCCGRS